MERSVPSHRESIWQCTEMPDHPTVAPVRMAASWWLSRLAAALTPPESSNVAERIACVISLTEKRASTSSTVPVSVQKNNTYAQMSRVFKVAFLMAEVSIPASKWIFEDVNWGVFHSLFFLRFCSTYSKIPLKIAEKTAHRYRKTPKFIFFHNVVPIVLMKNAEEGMEEQANTRSHSSRVSIPFWHDRIAHRAPTGNPHKSPNTKAEHPARKSPNTFPKGRSSGRAIHSPIPLVTSNSAITKKGKSEGRIVPAQSESPWRIQLATISARRSIKAKQKKSKIERQTAPNLWCSAFFVYACCNVILPLLVA